MKSHYVACDLGAESGRVVFGTLHNDELSLSETHRFENAPITEGDSLQWNIPHLYQETLEGLRMIGAYEENVASVSCNSWASDYLLFGSDGAVITPAYHRGDRRSEDGRKKVFSKVPWETVYEETGVQQMSANTLFQLGAEKWLRLRRASHLMPVADAFNFLLGGLPRVEMSLASTTQLYNPVTKAWSDRLLQALRLPPELFPTVVPSGTELGTLRPEVAKETGLEETRIISSCSHEIAAALVGLPVEKGETWAYLQSGLSATIGAELLAPVINDVGREWNFTNELGYGGSVQLSKQLPGLWILEECRRAWKERDREMDGDLLIHLATSAEPFESLINLADPRFHTPGNMPQKIQEFCKETGQPV